MVNSLPAAALAQMFATGNGMPPNSGVQLVNNLSPGAPLRDLFSFSPSTAAQDMNLDGALCLRDLVDRRRRRSRSVAAGAESETSSATATCTASRR